VAGNQRQSTGALDVGPDEFDGGGSVLSSPMTFLVGRVVTSREAAGFSPLLCWRPVFDRAVAIAPCLSVPACWLFVDANTGRLWESQFGEEG